MNSPAAPFEALSLLLRYPDGEYRESLACCRATLENLAASSDFQPNGGSDPLAEAKRRIDNFTESIRGLSVEELQELFTQTFDLNPVCALEVGWHLYGEEYSRGTFMVSMRGLLRKHGVDECGELPDHLTNLLPVVDRMEDHERRYFAEKYLTPALTKMLAAFEGKDSPYAKVMQALHCLVESVTEPVLEEVPHG